MAGLVAISGSVTVDASGRRPARKRTQALRAENASSSAQRAARAARVARRAGLRNAAEAAMVEAAVAYVNDIVQETGVMTRAARRRAGVALEPVALPAARVRRAHRAADGGLVINAGRGITIKIGEVVGRAKKVVGGSIKSESAVLKVFNDLVTALSSPATKDGALTYLREKFTTLEGFRDELLLPALEQAIARGVTPEQVETWKAAINQVSPHFGLQIIPLADVNTNLDAGADAVAPVRHDVAIQVNGTDLAPAQTARFMSRNAQIAAYVALFGACALGVHVYGPAVVLTFIAKAAVSTVAGSATRAALSGAGCSDTVATAGGMVAGFATGSFAAPHIDALAGIATPAAELVAERAAHAATRGVLTTTNTTLTETTARLAATTTELTTERAAHAATTGLLDASYAAHNTTTAALGTCTTDLAAAEAARAAAERLVPSSVTGRFVFDALATTAERAGALGSSLRSWFSGTNG